MIALQYVVRPLCLFNDHCVYVHCRDLTLDFIWDTVLPAVVSELQIELGEVAITGFR